MKALIGENETNAISQTIAGGAAAGGGVYVKETLSHYYENVGKNIPKNNIIGTHLGDAVDSGLGKYAQPANQNFPKVGTVGKLMGPVGLVIGFGVAGNEIYAAIKSGGDWQGEAIKQSSILGTSTAVGVAVGTMVGGPIGAVAGAIIGGGVGYAMDRYYDDILEGIKSAADAGLSAVEAVAQVYDNLKDNLNDVLEDVSDNIDDILDYGKDLLDDLADNLPEFPDINLPPWLQDVLGPLADAPGIARSGGSGGGGDPLVIDLDRDGDIELTSLENGVHFDLWGDGYAKQMGWVATDDGLLAFDKDGDGKIEGVNGFVEVANDNEKGWARLPLRCA